ncbi:MAG: HNH endonuclease [Ignavibacteriae bacterium]|nr:HNH endonuclease [Ignavibacteriota bacterium]NOG98334.1 HNH endonuclease [Ignavibacteriota bacterium]
MAISEKDIKKLWGRAAGRCSKPGCEEECVKFLDASDPTIVGEMAHIIAKKPDGPRGIASGGEDTYDNLILLCPTHHTEIDKALEGVFTIQELNRWKSQHEQNVTNSFKSPKYSSKEEMAKAINILLSHNFAIWMNFGPESPEASKNPLSNLVEFWNFRKLDTLIPNNRKIINIIKRNSELFELKDLQYGFEFIEHAEGFERNCYEKTEGTLRFPIKFQEVINNYGI